MGIIKTSKERPEIYEKCALAFNVKWKDGVIITYGDTVYCRFSLPKQKLVHEEVHIHQQAEMGVNEWWDKYFLDEHFRLDQELEAYRTEYKWIVENIKDFLEKNRRVDVIAKDLSSSMYGNLLTYEEALNLIKN